MKRKISLTLHDGQLEKLGQPEQLEELLRELGENPEGVESLIRTPDPRPDRSLRSRKTFQLSEEALQILDQVAAKLKASRSSVLRRLLVLRFGPPEPVLEIVLQEEAS